MISQAIGNAVQRNYQYDSAGRIVNITEGDAASTYEYDSVDRLTYESGVTEKLRKHEYSYVDGGNQLAAITRIKDNGNLAANSHQRAYDSNGNTISRNKHSFVYNQAERLVEVYKKNQLVVNYTYNGFGQRAIRTKHKSDNDIRTIHYHYNQSGPMLGQTRYNNAGVLKVNKDIIWLDNMPVAQLITRYKKSGDIKRTELVYIHTDHLNTPRYATDSKQDIVWEWASDAFGVGKVNTDPDGDGKKTFIPLRFPGQINSDTGLYYNYFRDYDPQTGRYIQADPRGILLDFFDPARQLSISPSFLILTPLGYVNHLYGYVDQNPLNGVDPTGEVAPIVIVAGASAAGAVAQGLTTALRGGSIGDVGSAIVGGAILGAGIGIGAATGTLSGAAIGGLIGIAGDAITAADTLGYEDNNSCN